MTSTIIGLLVLVALAVLFAWLAVRAWRARRAWVKWVGVVLAGFFTLLFALLAVVSARGIFQVYRHHTVAVPEVTVAGTAEQVARGEHLAEVLCTGCHSLNGDLPLSGGRNLSQDAGLPFGDVFAPNLTPATDIKDWQDSDLLRVIRTGVDDTGRATAMAGVIGPQVLSDEDTLAVIAYLRQAPAVEHETPEFKPSILMALMEGAGLIKEDVPAAVSVVSAPPKAATAAYGEYVLGYMDCKSCHGEKLDGKVAPPYPAGPDIRNLFAKWSEEDFVNMIHAHVTAPEGGEVMPWKDISRLDNVELEALYLYLHQVGSQQ